MGPTFGTTHETPTFQFTHPRWRLLGAGSQQQGVEVSVPGFAQRLGERYVGLPLTDGLPAVAFAQSIDIANSVKTGLDVPRLRHN